MSAFLSLAVKDLKHIQASEKETTQKHDSLLEMGNQSTHKWAQHGCELQDTTLYNHFQCFNLESETEGLGEELYVIN